MKLFGQPVALTRAAAAFAAMGLLAAGVTPDNAWAGPAAKVYRPVVEFGETEIELRGGYIKDDGPANTTQAYVLDFGHGVTPWWFTEAVMELEKEPDGHFEVEEIEWENIFQLSEPGEYVLDYGLFAELKIPLASGLPYAVEIGPMFQKEFGRLVSNLNLLAERQFGDNAVRETEIAYRLQSRYRSGAAVDFGVQGFGEENAHLLGPAVFGQARLGERNKFKWDAAVLAGLTEDAEDFRFRWQLEFEF